MADSKNVDNSPEGEILDDVTQIIATPISALQSKSETESVKTSKTQRMSSSADRQVKFERAQKALENAALVSKRIKEHRKATAELLGKPFEDDDVGDTADVASTVSERTGYSVATDISTNLSVQDALNIPGISESLANTLKQKELLMERIKQYKEISKRPMKSSSVKRDSISEGKTNFKRNVDSASDTTQLLNTIKEKENALSVMQVKIKAMETTILDLQEKINEKDQVIEAKNMATTLISDSLSKKEKDSCLLLEDTKQQMTKMQENFISMENEWKQEKLRLLKEIEAKDEKIKNLEEANTILENSRFEITVTHSKMLEELDKKQQQILELEEAIIDLNEEKSVIEKEDEPEKGSLEINQMVELTKKIELLEQLNCQIRQTNIELENKLANVNIESKQASTVSPSKKGSPLPNRKGGRSSSAKVKSPWSSLSTEQQQDTEKKSTKNEIAKLEMLIQSLNKDILNKEFIISQKDLLISELQALNTSKDVILTDLKSSQTENVEVTDMGTEMEDTKICKETNTDVGEEDTSQTNSLLTVELKERLNAALQQIATLNEEIDMSNKNMVKVKSNHKTKLKQMQKTIDNLSKVSDSNAEIVRLNEELHQLSQKVAELEEEKGNLQLHLVDYDSGRLTESDVYKKMIEMESLSETRLKAISLLETQKFDLVQDLHILQQKYLEIEDKLADMTQLQNEQVCSEMKSVQLEEQIDELISSRKELVLIVENLKLDKEHLIGEIDELKKEKEEIMNRLDSYIQENIELTDKLEKLSAEKVSSAESIEIVESLTTQEKLELEEYNKGISETKNESAAEQPVNIEVLVDQITELNKKISLFTQEREEVMDKMCKLTFENEKLHNDILEISSQCDTFRNNINVLNLEKQDLEKLNSELNHKLEELKRERLDIIKETAEITKPIVAEETTEITSESHPDDKVTGDKSINRTKSVKQLTKEILKLKNTIKEREAEIGDCQMKILSLEEQHQKQSELIQSNATFESNLKALTIENQLLKEKLAEVNEKEFNDQLSQLKQTNELLQIELQKTHEEYNRNVIFRDTRINELENVLLEYEKQIQNYSNSLQQKDKDIVDYVNQITKLNDVSQKLKSTIELLEEEKAKDQNGEMIKSLNKQITNYQKKLADYEEKLKILEEDKAQLLLLKASLQNENVNLEKELKNIQESFIEKENLVKELQSIQHKHTEEVRTVMSQVKERDEEIHEIKLQLRKESIENEKLRNVLLEKEKNIEEYLKVIQESKDKLDNISSEKNQSSEQFTILETKNKELMDKLKKFAINIKKKSTMYTELEAQLHDVQKQLEDKTVHLEQLTIQVKAFPTLQEKLKHAEEEINRLQSLKITNEHQKSEEIGNLNHNLKSLEKQLIFANSEIARLNEALNIAYNNLAHSEDIIAQHKTQVEALNNKLVEYEIDLKNSINFTTKVSALESDINKKQAYIVELTQKIENQEQAANQLKFGYDAKVQERELYIESLETEMNKYKNRICRLEETISVMEDRRHSLERKADQLDNQLQEKQKAYSEHSSQEDVLINRLAVLMDHDRVVEKQLHEIEEENRLLHNKVQYFSEENERLSKTVSEMQDHYNNLLDQARQAESAENEALKYQSQLKEIEMQHKQMVQEHHSMIMRKKHDIEELESEFNTQIENAIKEKKILSDKYEKIIEQVGQLEIKLQEYRNENERLTINMEELNKVNQELVQRSTLNCIPVAPDYTEQYINEINKLNSVINKNNNDINDLSAKLEAQQVTYTSNVSNYETKISDLTNKLRQSVDDVDQLLKEVNTLKTNNEQLQELLLQKEEQINELKEKKKVTFEMNIPKTEGMVISSTIEALNVTESDKCDVLDIQSQIIPYDITTEPVIDEKSETLKTVQTIPTTSVVEDVIVPQKAYLCYKNDENTEEVDPFNSEEGWGLGYSEIAHDVVPEMPQLKDQIEKLRKENDTLKSDLHTMNTKLVKVMKKFKEIKSNNEMLSNELKLSKHLTQSSLLDCAIEDELRNNIQELEKKLGDLSADLLKERREKESVKKQVEVFSNANDKLTDMKEKLENQVELWKYKFQEVNDKVSSIQWSEEHKDSSESKPSLSAQTSHKGLAKEEFNKLEIENDELQNSVDQLTKQNNELMNRESNLKSEINNLSLQVQLLSKYENLVVELENKNKETLNLLNISNSKLSEIELTYSECLQSYENIKANYAESQVMYEKEKKELLEIIGKLEKDLKLANELDKERNLQVDAFKNEIEILQRKLILKESAINDEFDAINKKYICLEDEHLQLKKHNEDLIVKLKEAEELKLKLVSENDLLKEKSKKDVENLITDGKCKSLDEECLQLKQQLAELQTQLVETESLKKQLDTKLLDYEHKITELQSKMDNLNGENDELLSTVAELRSSVSSAVDQRGFEIAELWKQHLAQREADFLELEQGLRVELSASEAKYEQLLDSVQSNSQEETNNVIIIEQVTSLQNKIQDKEEHLRNLQDKYSEVMSQLDMLRSEQEDEKVMYENKLLAQQDDYEKLMIELRTKNQEDTEKLIQELNDSKGNFIAIKIENDELKRQIEDLTGNIILLETTITDLNNKLHLKESEIYQKSSEFTIALNQRNEEFENVRKHLLEYEKKIEDITYEKEAELAVLRLKMHENLESYDQRNDQLQSNFYADKSALNEVLNSKIMECTNLNKLITDLNKQLEEHSSKANETQMVLENQEIEIVALKDEVNNLQQTIKKITSKIEKHVTFASDTKVSSDNDLEEGLINKELLDAVPRAELDLALYMLHQRDVRCEELTMELTQLLDERDTLQLRLSDSLRSNEDLKSKLRLTETDLSTDSIDAVSELPSFSSDREHQLFVDTHRGQSSRSSSISDVDPDKPKLQAKLSELRTVKHSRDVRLRQDSEQRQLGIRLMQRDVANLPPEAVDQLAQAHHTLTRDSQSTSTVLLNWLRGKSTPKVVHM